MIVGMLFIYESLLVIINDFFLKEVRERGEVIRGVVGGNIYRPKEFNKVNISSKPRNETNKTRVHWMIVQIAKWSMMDN